MTMSSIIYQQKKISMYKYFIVISLFLFALTSCQPISTECPLLAVPIETDNISHSNNVEIIAFKGSCNLDSAEFIQLATITIVAKDKNGDNITFSNLTKDLTENGLDFYVAVIDTNKGIIKKSIFQIDIKANKNKKRISRDIKILFNRKLYPDFPNYTIIAGFTG